MHANSRLKRLARFSPHCGTLQSRELRSKPDAITANRRREVKFSSEPPEALVTATQRGDGSFMCSPTLRSRRLVLVTATADPEK
ncbi:uncharacterized protein TrAtP1_006403 [Trichoderma atroviride]|uniref:uncharacterized protein n=1 Tax=Hypocrea atroviridis TaxID=63577 RepID=UPI003319349E|nr:hypothetical protein TrAtP1_006403 [Trichoderma atroviride]